MLSIIYGYQLKVYWKAKIMDISAYVFFRIYLWYIYNYICNKMMCEISLRASLLMFHFDVSQVNHAIYQQKCG